MSKKILCVDDDPFYECLYKDMLTTRGFEVEHAFDAAAGFEAANRFKPDLITVDIMMPERKGIMDGYALIETLRDSEEFSQTPIIMISALGEDADAKRAMDVGASAFIPKQKLSPDGLKEAIDELLKK